MTITKTENRGRPAKVKDNKQGKFIELYGQYSNEELADIYDVTISAIQKASRKNGMRKSKTGRPCSAPDKEELILLCGNHTDKEIAEILNVCPGTVAYWRKKAGITKYSKVS